MCDSQPPRGEPSYYNPEDLIIKLPESSSSLFIRGRFCFQIEMFLQFNFSTCNWIPSATYSGTLHLPASLAFCRGHSRVRWYQRWILISTIFQVAWFLPPDRSCCIFPNRFSNDLASPWLQIWRGWFSTEWGPSRWLRWVTGASTMAGTLAVERKEKISMLCYFKTVLGNGHMIQIQSQML